ncbi:uncharacterized protein LOC144341347 [Macaca mulatta]
MVRDQKHLKQPSVIDQWPFCKQGLGFSFSMLRVLPHSDTISKGNSHGFPLVPSPLSHLSLWEQLPVLSHHRLAPDPIHPRIQTPALVQMTTIFGESASDKRTVYCFSGYVTRKTYPSGKAESLNLQNTHSPRLPSTVSYVQTANGLERPVSRLGSQRLPTLCGRHRHLAGGRSRPALRHKNLTLKSAEAGLWEGRGLGGAARSFRPQRTTRRPPPAPVAVAQKPREQSFHAPRVPVPKPRGGGSGSIARPRWSRAAEKLQEALKSERREAGLSSSPGPPAPRSSAGQAAQRWAPKGQDGGMPPLPARERPRAAFLALGESPGKARRWRASLAAPLRPRAQEAGAAARVRYPGHTPRLPPASLSQRWPRGTSPRPAADGGCCGSREVAASARRARAPGSPPGLRRCVRPPRALAGPGVTAGAGRGRGSAQVPARLREGAPACRLERDAAPKFSPAGKRKS